MLFELYGEFKCSKCNNTFDCIEELDRDMTKKQITIKCSGYCDQCGRYENWTMVYRLKKIKKEKR